MRTSIPTIVAHISLCSAISLLAGCTVSKVTEQAVANSETVVAQAGQTIGNSESGAIELQRAREHLDKAKKAVDDRDEEGATRHAQEATLDARLATAKAQSAVARKAADEMRASTETLRQESQRTLNNSR
jgi:Domain of unknown function (DUF4398)